VAVVDDGGVVTALLTLHDLVRAQAALTEG